MDQWSSTRTTKSETRCAFDTNNPSQSLFIQELNNNSTKYEEKNFEKFRNSIDNEIVSISKIKKNEKNHYCISHVSVLFVFFFILISTWNCVYRWRNLFRMYTKSHRIHPSFASMAMMQCKRRAGIQMNRQSNSQPRISYA